MYQKNQYPYDEVVLARLGEIALKGLNRNRFEQQLFQNMKYRLRHEGHFQIVQRDSRIWLQAAEGKLNSSAVLSALKDVFGIVSASPVRRFEADEEVLKHQTVQWAEEIFSDKQPRSFKVEVKRINKQFPKRSYELCCDLGELILERFPDLARVDVKNPDLTFYVEIREYAYLYTEIIPARKGLPVGMGGKGMLLLSGGIDSPVAGYLMASRGMRLECCYFHTHPYTSEEAKNKVIRLAEILSRYCGRLMLHVVDFTELQLEINEKVADELITIVMRRMMLRIAEEIARRREVKCLITGESLGQVASQTLEAIVCTDRVAGMPVFRPLIGTDKDDTCRIARDIGSFETSILPYEDCCTVFVAKHPKTHPSLEEIEKAEAVLNIDRFIELGSERTEKIEIY